jgi:hypothetical protein
MEIRTSLHDIGWTASASLRQWEGASRRRIRQVISRRVSRFSWHAQLTIYRSLQCKALELVLCLLSTLAQYVGSIRV